VSQHLVVVLDERALARRAAEWIVERTRAAVASRGSCSVALAGGSTPRATYEVLGTSALAAAVPWAAIDWFFGDERSPTTRKQLSPRDETLPGGPGARARGECRRTADAAAAARSYGSPPDPSTW
jgi:hypothetical protein